MSPNATSPALQAASVFLTRPLALLGAVSPSTILALQLFLHSALSSSTPSPQLLSFTPTSLPPLPIQLACVAFGIKWAAWIRALGGAAFDLVVEPTRVYVIKKSTGQVGIIWVVSKDMGMDLDGVTLPTTTPQAPLDAEADDSGSGSESESEFDAPGSSRPSSRSSSHSASSVFSSISSHSSHSSLSTSTSHAKIALTTPAHTTTTPKPQPQTHSQPQPQPRPTKYLYQGGVSTVLTGGVMLGAASSSSPSSSSPPAAARTSIALTTPAPAVCKTGVYTPPHRARARARVPASVLGAGAGAGAGVGAGANAGSWRRRGGPASVCVAAF